MSDNDDTVQLRCKHCDHTWRSQLNILKKVVYRGEKKLKQPEISEYRAQCPNCGAYLIATIQAD